MTPTPDTSSQLSLTVYSAPVAGQQVTFTGTLQSSAATPVPIANAQVYVQFPKDNVNFQPYPGFTPKTDDNGAYKLPTQFAPPGTYYIRAVYYESSDYTQAISSVVTVTVLNAS